MNRYWLLQVKEMMDRHLDFIEIAHRLHLDPADVQMIIEFIKQAML